MDNRDNERKCVRMVCFAAHAGPRGHYECDIAQCEVRTLERCPEEKW